MKNRKSIKNIWVKIQRVLNSDLYLVTTENLSLGQIVEEAHVFNIAELVDYIKEMDCRNNKNRKYFAMKSKAEE